MSEAFSLREWKQSLKGFPRQMLGFKVELKALRLFDERSADFHYFTRPFNEAKVL